MTHKAKVILWAGGAWVFLAVAGLLLASVGSMWGAVCVGSMVLPASVILGELD